MPSSREQRTLHFVLPFAVQHPDLQLHVGRQRHALQRHSRSTLDAARQTNQALRLLPDDQVTHFVADLDLPARQAQLLLVSTAQRPAGARLRSLLLAKLHVPQAAYRRALQEARERGDIRPDPHPAILLAGGRDDGTNHDLPPDVEDVVTAYAAAELVVFHHPELCNIGDVAAATVKSIITYANGTSDLASAILQQARAHAEDPAATNWVEERPYTKPDGSPATTSRYVWSATTQSWMPTPLQAALRQVKNTASLQSSATKAGNYVVLEGVTTVSAAGTAQRGALRGTATRRDSGDGWTVNDYTPQHGFAYSSDAALSSGVFSASFTNSWLRWLSGYVEFLGPDGRTPVAPEGWTSQVPAGLAGSYDSATKKYAALFSSVSTILGIPVDASPTTISFNWPANAAGVRILAGGIGRTGGIPGQDGQYHGGWDSQVCAAGAIFTGLFCYGLPVICLAMGAVIPQTALADLAKSMIGTVLDLGSAIINGPLANMFTGEDLTSILIAFADAIPHLLLDAPDLVLAIDAAVAEEAVEEATPIFGWIALGASVLATVAGLVETSVEVGLSPAVFDLVATRAIDAQWILLPDPGHKIWPLEATHYVCTATFGDGTTRVATGTVTPGPNAAPLALAFTAAAGNALPGGGTVTFTANIYSGDDWLCGTATSQPLSAAIEGGSLTVPEQAIVEQVVPLSAATRYVYRSSLTWDAAGSRHAWGNARPSATIGALDPGNAGSTLGALGQVTVNTPQSQLGYSWQASGQNLPVGPGGPPSNNQLYAFQTVATGQDPEAGLRFVPSGFIGAARVQYGPQAGTNGPNFYLDPTGGTNHLRQILLDGSSGLFSLPVNASWGRFNQGINACIVHPDGVAIGLNTANARFEVLRLPSAATTDATAPLADIFGGYGGRPGLLHQPIGIAPALGSGIIVLENPDTSLSPPAAARLQAFDLRGNPVPIFAGVSTAPVRPESGPVTGLAIATEPKGFIYVLKYVGAGAQPEDYLLDLYAPDGSFLCQTPGLPAGGIAVDPWRTLYTLDFQAIAKPAGLRPEPSVSLWTPTTP